MGHEPSKGFWFIFFTVLAVLIVVVMVLIITAKRPVASEELPPFKVEPTTTITARP